NAKAPPPPAAPRRPATPITKSKRAWIWAALIGLIFGLAFGTLASFLILNSKEHLANQMIASLEEQRDDALSAKKKAEKDREKLNDDLKEKSKAFEKSDEARKSAEGKLQQLKSATKKEESNGIAQKKPEEKPSIAEKP